MNKIKPFIKKYNQILLILTGLIAWCLGAYGYSHIFTGNWLDPLYASLKHFTLDMAVPQGEKINVWIECSRWLAAIALAGAIINIFSMLAKNSYDKLRLMFFCKRHVIICGVGLKGDRLVENIQKKGHTVVVIEINPNNPALQILSQKGVIVVTGTATDGDVLRNAMLDQAEYLIAVTGNDQTNLAIAQAAIGIKEESASNKMLQCIAHISDDSLRKLLYQHHSIASPHPNFDLRLFSFYESGAHEIIRDYLSQNLRSFASVSEDEIRPLHLMLVGFGRIGKSVAIEAARMGGCPDGSKLSVSVFAKSADVHEKKIRHNLPKLFELLNFRFYSTDVEFLPENLSELFYNELPVDLVVVSLGDELLNFKAAHELANKFRDATKPPKIVICGNGELGQLIDASSKIQSYSMLDKVCTYEVVVNADRERMAKSIHQNYLRHNFETPTSKPWQELPLEFKDSNRDQAEHIRVKLKLVGCTIADQDTGTPTSLTEEEVQKLACVEHARWMAEKILQGWSYGAQRDNAKKIHPCLISYDLLSEEDKEKDIDSVRNIHNLVQSNGQILVRLLKN